MKIKLKVFPSKPQPAPKETYSCGHPVDGTLSCWRCTVKRLKERYYGSNSKEDTMKLTIKKTTVEKVLKEKPAPKAKAPKAPKTKPAPSSVPVTRTTTIVPTTLTPYRHRKTSVVGKKHKLSINHTWVKLFSENETLAAKGKALTDEQISAAIKAEFPGRKTKAFDNVSSVRSRYNHGLLSQDAPPKVKSESHHPKEK